MAGQECKEYCMYKTSHTLFLFAMHCTFAEFVANILFKLFFLARENLPMFHYQIHLCDANAAALRSTRFLPFDDYITRNY